jgi:hypothetical protein
MAKKSGKKTAKIVPSYRTVIGCALRNGAIDPSSFHARECATYLTVQHMHEIFVGLKSQNEEVFIATFVQSEERAVHEYGMLKVLGTPIAMLQEGIAKFDEYYETKKPRERNPKHHSVMFALGDQAFCDAFIRYWGNGCPEEPSSWHVKMLERISAAKVTDVFWIDSKTDNRQIHEANLMDMRVNVRQMLGLPTN